MSADFAAWVDENPLLERCAPVPFGVICFRAVPPGLEGEDELNSFNEKLLNKINSTGNLFLTHTKLDGKFVIRLAIGSIRTKEQHVEKAKRLINGELSELSASH